MEQSNTPMSDLPFILSLFKNVFIWQTNIIIMSRTYNVDENIILSYFQRQIVKLIRQDVHNSWLLCLKIICITLASFIAQLTLALYFSGLQGSWSVHVCCLHLKMEFRSCSRRRQWCGIIHYYWWTASIKPRLLFSSAGYASWELSFSSV